MKKKFLCLMLAVCACLSTTTAYAHSDAPEPLTASTAILTLVDGQPAEVLTITLSDGSAMVVDPRLTAIRRLTSGASRSGSTMSCTATIRPYSGYNAEVQLTIQRSTNKSSWSEVKSWESTVTNTSDDTVIAKSSTISSGYYYRLLVQATAYENGTDKYIETVTAASSPFYY